MAAELTTSQEWTQGVLALNLKGMEEPKNQLIEVSRLWVQHSELTESRSVREMALSIKANGLLQPPAVYYDQKTETYNVIYGNRRVEACKMLGIEKIFCKVYPRLSVVQEAALVLAENVTRSPAWAREVQALSTIIVRTDASDKQIAAVLGKPLSQVQKMLNLARLPRPFVDAMLDGRLSQAAAVRTLRMTQAQRGKIEAFLKEGGTVTAEQVQEARSERVQAALTGLEDLLEGPAPVSTYNAPVKPLAAPVQVPETVVYTEYSQDPLEDLKAIYPAIRARLETTLARPAKTALAYLEAAMVELAKLQKKEG